MFLAFQNNGKCLNLNYESLLKLWYLQLCRISFPYSNKGEHTVVKEQEKI